MWHEPGVAVVLTVADVVTEPPAGVGVVDMLLVVVVVEGGVAGVGAVMVVELLVVDVVCAVCADSGTANARLTASTPTASNAFIGDPPSFRPNHA